VVGQEREAAAARAASVVPAVAGLVEVPDLAVGAELAQVVVRKLENG
jgi:hypothetical protein